MMRLLAGTAEAATDTFTSSGTWTAPAGVTSATVEAWGGGGAGGGATSDPAKGGGGAGGQYASKVVVVVPGNLYAVAVGDGGTGSTGNGTAGGDSTFDANVVVAKGGAGGTGATNGVAGTGTATGGIGDNVYAGGSGSAGAVDSNCNDGGAGGGGAGSGGAGGSASGNTEGTGRATGGGVGGAGRNSSGTGNPGTVAGGGGGGACAESGTDRTGGAGARGQVVITYISAPSVTTTAATSVTAIGATLNGTVSSNGASTTVTFDYGLTTAYGSSATAAQSPLIAGASGTAVSAAVSGLTCNTTYHFRVNGSNSIGTTNGSDLTFTTSACPVTPATGGSAIASNTAPGCAASGTWTTLSGPSLREVSVGGIGVGTIVLTAPTGFEFNTAATVTIQLTTGSGTNTRNINNIALNGVVAVTSITATAITFTVTESSVTTTQNNTLLWQGIQVRPTASTPLASGNITHTGTSSITNVDTSTNFGTLTEVASSPACNLTAPTVAKSFTDSTIGANSTSILTITITNPNTTTINGVALADTYPSTDLKNASTPALANSCGGTATGTAGASALSLSGGSVPASSSCSISVNVTSAVAGSYVNSTGAVTSTNAASGTAASATLTVTAAVVSAANSTVVASPTSVAADGATISTVTVTLKDGTGAGVAGKTVTLAADSGSSIITTMSGTTDASGVATFTVKDATIEGPITYTATDATDSIVITQTAQVTFVTPSLCFSDDFNRTTGLLATSTWTRTKGTGTTLDAEIVNNRLRLTDASGSRATAVHLSRLFPGAGNKVVAEFTYFAYDGTGADGLAITLSDSSIAPVAGAYGGSLGYAQKGSTSDCGTCPGFAGGWIGVGLDEYGNYLNGGSPDGRVDGAPTSSPYTRNGSGLLPDSVTIRGSGFGQNGYNWHATVQPTDGGIDSPAGHRYRVTVDHSDGVHAWTSVDRDTTGGTNYTNVIPVYDAKAIPTQAAVPPYWFFSFTASTGSVTNIHEIDDFTVCTALPIVTPTLDHVRIVHDGSALTCAPETITVKACANAACSALYPGSVTVDLGTISGATWSSDPVTFASGQVQVTLTKTSAGTVALSGVTTAPSSMIAVCYNGSTSGDCSLTYSSNACVFDAVETGKLPSTPIFTKLAGTAFTVDVLALTAGAINTGYTGTVTVDLVDQTGVAAGSCGTTSLASPTSPTSPYTFTGGNAGRRTFTFSYPNAAKNVRVRMQSGAVTACSSDNFAIRPTSFSVTSPNATNTGTTGTPVIKTGAPFELDATSLNNYTGTALVNHSKIAAHSGAVQTGTLSGTFSAATLASSWVSKGLAFSYSEVGNFHFTPWGIYDDGSFVDVDRSKSTPECVIDNKLGTTVDPTNPNVIDLNGKYGCYFGGMSTSSSFGRFIPDHFAIAQGASSADCATHPAASAGYIPTDFTYFGKDGFTTVFTLTAQNASNAPTLNYVGDGTSSWAKLPLTTWAAAPASAGSPGYGFAVSAWSPSQPSGAAIIASSTAPTATNSNTWVLGSAMVTARHKITRPNNPAAPTTVTVSALPVDSDGVTMTTATSVGSSEQRFGILHMDNSYGSELLGLPIPIEAQYWNGSFYTVNTDDSCTVFPASSIVMSNYLQSLNACETHFSPVGSLTMSGGLISSGLVLTAPGSGNTGSVDLTLNIGSSASGNTCTSAVEGLATAASRDWFGVNPSARATFGIYTGNSHFIYIRELY